MFPIGIQMWKKQINNIEYKSLTQRWFQVLKTLIPLINSIDLVKFSIQKSSHRQSYVKETFYSSLKIATKTKDDSYFFLALVYYVIIESFLFPFNSIQELITSIISQLGSLLASNKSHLGSPLLPKYTFEDVYRIQQITSKDIYCFHQITFKVEHVIVVSQSKSIPI